MLDTVLQAYGFSTVMHIVHPFGTGLINSTWKIEDHSTGEAFIVQKINHHVFKRPNDIAENVRLIGDFLQEQNPDYLFVRSISTLKGEDVLYVEGEGYFRAMPFVKNSHTLDVLQTPGQAFEAAKQFGTFTRLLKDFPVHQLNITIPDFHNLVLRYDQFLTALEEGSAERIRQSAEEIQFLKDCAFIVGKFKQMKDNPLFKLRVTHHDTKISNVLFDESDKGLCVIDLDTVMPGYYISDVGDMMRTCLCPVSEEETDFSKIEIRIEYYKAIAEGYLDGLKNELSEAEKASLFDAGCYLMYMQALRFLTDHLNNDVYYGASYEGHNFNRARNQIILLQKMLEMEAELRDITADVQQN